MTKYCPTCSRSSEDSHFIGEFCEFCVSKKIAEKLPNEIRIPICKVCSRIKIHKDDWLINSKRNLESIINNELHKIGCKVNILQIDKYGNAELTIDCPVPNYLENIVFDYKIKINFKNETCIKCIRRSTGYYQAIVQLRGDKEKIERMRDKISRFLEKRDSFISKIENKDGGLDLFVEDKQKMNSFFDIYKSIKPKRSYTLAGMKNGKKLYRNKYYIDLYNKDSDEE